MIVSYNWLQSFFNKKLPSPKELADILTMKSFQVDEVRKSGKDWILNIDVLPNRASDCLSHFGIALECGAVLDYKLKEVFPKVKEEKNIKTRGLIRVEVENKEDCSRYVSRAVADIKVAESPKWVQERLTVCGLRPINNVVDAVNYVMLETGQPLHVFDIDKISGIGIKKSIIVRRAKKGEKITSLDNEEYDLNGDILIIADNGIPLAIAGIKGGKKAEITGQTKNIILEAANFNPVIIRRGSRKLKLRTDASIRFEHGIDPNLAELAINNAAVLIKEIAGGKIARGSVDFYPQKLKPKRVKLNLERVERLLGTKIAPPEIKRIFLRLGFKLINNGLSKKDSKNFLVEIPTRRLDISISEDLTEEIGRIHGYEKIKEIFPMGALIPPQKNLDIFWENMAKDVLKESGFSEEYNDSFLAEKDAELFGGDIVEALNPVSVEYKYLRPSLIPNLLKNIVKNQKTYEDIKIFELGRVFIKTDKKTVQEKRMLSGAIIGDKFYEAKGVIDVLLNKLGISEIWYDDCTPRPDKPLWLQPKKCAGIRINDKQVGFIGEVSSVILRGFKVEKTVVMFDIDFEKLQNYCSQGREYRPISIYPSAIRDIAVLVPSKILAEEVLNKIEIAGGILIRDVDLFDMYEGEELPEGKKNLAFHIIYQAEDRTLSSKEIDEVQNKIIKTLEEDPEWEVRK